eukprot:Protomagalhaensia_wolfi_Nauph_80__3529@NODE_357_length_2683_cov_557_664523_g269_i0_p1_GENE_NODE_357_length_2683_cov_557_664523_g269_i0NODE_357_length_2683_cov_557_664523_g269_i0_p1_ORF_typecomplete_len399_score53_43_NODE_357_length_2683_cov_557_664523_g269_i01711367
MNPYPHTNIEGVVANRIACARQSAKAAVSRSFRPGSFCEHYPLRPRLFLTPGDSWRRRQISVIEATGTPQPATPAVYDAKRTTTECAAANPAVLKKPAADPQSSPPRLPRPQFKPACSCTQNRSSDMGTKSPTDFQRANQVEKSTVKNAKKKETKRIETTSNRRVPKVTSKRRSKITKRAAHNGPTTTDKSSNVNTEGAKILTLEHWKFVSHKEQFGSKPCETDADRLERAKMKLQGAIDFDLPPHPSPRLLQALLRGDERLLEEPSEAEDEDEEDYEKQLVLGGRGTECEVAAGGAEDAESPTKIIEHFESPSPSQIRVPLGKPPDWLCQWAARNQTPVAESRGAHRTTSRAYSRTPSGKQSYWMQLWETTGAKRHHKSGGDSPPSKAIKVEEFVGL